MFTTKVVDWDYLHPVSDVCQRNCFQQVLKILIFLLCVLLYIFNFHDSLHWHSTPPPPHPPAPLLLLSPAFSCEPLHWALICEDMLRCTHPPSVAWPWRTAHWTTCAASISAARYRGSEPKNNVPRTWIYGGHCSGTLNAVYVLIKGL